MYILQTTPDRKAVTNSGAEVTPLATLKDEYGGISHIIEDDHCFVLLNGSEDRPFQKTYHWYPEAVEALKTLRVPQPA